MLSSFAERTLMLPWIFQHCELFFVAAVVRCIYLYYVQVIPNPFLMPPSPPGSGWGICGGEILVKAVNFHHDLGHKNNNLHITSEVTLCFMAPTPSKSKLLTY